VTAEASTLITVPVCATGTGTVRLVSEVICRYVVPGVHFDFDFAFVRPNGKTAVDAIVTAIKDNTQDKVLIVGHTDRVGLNAYNEALSRRRARSVYAYVIQDVDGWMELLRTMLSSPSSDTTARTGTGQSYDRWQTRELQYILQTLRRPNSTAFYYTGLADNVFGTTTQSALDDFRSDNGLPAGGGSGPRWAGVDEDTWRKLFELYMKQDATQLDAGHFLAPPVLGCGENYPLEETRAPGTQSQDLVDANARSDTNRRVEFLLIPPALVPNPVTCDALYKNPDHPIVDCPTDPQPVTVTLHFTDPANQSKANLAVHVAGWGGVTRNFTTDAAGKVILSDNDTTQGDYRVSVEGNFRLALRDPGQGTVQNNEISLHVTQSVLVEIIVSAITRTLELHLIDERDAPLKNVKYHLQVGSQNLTGTTDDQGVVKQDLPDGTTTARLILDDKLYRHGGANGDESLDVWGIDLQIADLDPPDQVAGAKARLNNLGLFAGPQVDGTTDDLLKRALQRFQTWNALPTSGTLDDGTAQKLREKYGS